MPVVLPRFFPACLMMTIDYFLVVCTTIASILVYAVYSKCARRSPLYNIPGPASTSFLTGNLQQLFDKKDGQAFFDHLSQDYQKVVRFHGILGAESLLIHDTLALYHIIIKDHDLYGLPEVMTVNFKFLFGGQGLVDSVGEPHKLQRKLFAPAFSAVAMRNMCSIFYTNVHKLRTAIRARVKHGTCEIDMARWMSRTALQLIGESGLGYSFDNLTEDEPVDDFAQSVILLDEVGFPFTVPLMFSPAVLKFVSPTFIKHLINITPWPALHRFRGVLNDLHEHSLRILRDKQQTLLDGDAALAKKVGQGKDIMSILLRANMDAPEDEKMADNDVLAQIIILISAATDTTSTSLSRVLHLLAQRPHVQEKLRQELIDARAKAGGEDISYDDVSSLPYLDAICRETLRLYAPIPFRERVTNVDTVLPLSKPIQGVDGKEIHEIHIPEGTPILVNIDACNRDPEIWGMDAEEWKPERWLAPLPDSVAAAHVPGIYMNLLTFWGGQKACIGFKFSQLEMKLVLSLLVESFQFDLPVDKEITWKFGTLLNPSVLGDELGTIARMPLQVTLRM